MYSRQTTRKAPNRDAHIHTYSYLCVRNCIAASLQQLKGFEIIRLDHSTKKLNLHINISNGRVWDDFWPIFSASTSYPFLIFRFVFYFRLPNTHTYTLIWWNVQELSPGCIVRRMFSVVCWALPSFACLIFDGSSVLHFAFVLTVQPWSSVYACMYVCTLISFFTKHVFFVIPKAFYGCM